MTVKSIVTGPISVNTYIIINKKECIVIDPGANYSGIMEEIGDNIKVVAVLLTHGHFDHIGAVSEFQNMGINIYIHQLDENKLSNQKLLAAYYGMTLTDLHTDKLLYGNEMMNLAGLEVKIIHTPGHTSGCVVYIINDCIFSGDTLFYESYGRCDLFDGDFYSIKESIINKIFALNNDYTVYPGHGISTTLSHERVYNPILND